MGNTVVADLALHLETTVDRLLAAEHRLTFVEERLKRLDNGDGSGEAQAQSRRLVGRLHARLTQEK
jgi:hypothetical protein